MSELLIHIGGAKTGSTALQNSLFAARSDLQAQGIHLAGNLKYNLRNPEELALMFTFDPESWYCKRHNISSHQEYTQRISPILQALILELTHAATVFKQSILSSEHLSFMLDSEHKIKVLRDTLTKPYARASIVHYFRDPISLCRAAYSQALRGEYTGSYQQFCLEIIQGKRPFCEYGVLAERWTSVFGVRNCYFANGLRETLINNDITDDFAQYLLANLPLSKTQFSRQSRQNPSLKRMGCIAFRLINIECPYWISSEGKTHVNPLNAELKINVERLLAIKDEMIFDPIEDELFKARYHNILHLGRYAKSVADSCLEKADTLLSRRSVPTLSPLDEASLAAELISEAAENIAEESLSKQTLSSAKKFALEKVVELMKRHKKSKAPAGAE